MAGAMFSLLAFCPSSGVGVYSAGSTVHGFDLVTEEDEEIDAPQPGDIGAVAQFASRNDLLLFATTEYLRDKKTAYWRSRRRQQS